MEKLKRILKIFFKNKWEEIKERFGWTTIGESILNILKGIGSVILFLMFAIVFSGVMSIVCAGLGWLIVHIPIVYNTIDMKMFSKELFTNYALFGLAGAFVLIIVGFLIYQIPFKFCVWIYDNWKTAKETIEIEDNKKNKEVYNRMVESINRRAVVKKRKRKRK